MRWDENWGELSSRAAVEEAHETIQKVESVGNGKGDVVEFNAFFPDLG